MKIPVAVVVEIAIVLAVRYCDNSIAKLAAVQVVLQHRFVMAAAVQRLFH